MYDVKNKVVIVTGGGAGLGALFTKEFLKEGAKHVAILDVDVTNGKSLEKELKSTYGDSKVKFYKCDVTSKDLDDAFESVFKEHGYIDIVVNNAGIMNDSPKFYEKMIAVNVTALITSSLKAYNLMRKDDGGKGGTIINISSIAGITQLPCLPIYHATKSAVLQFSNGLGDETIYQRTGVRILTICFGCTDTSLLHSVKYGTVDKVMDEEDVVGKTIKSAPMQTPESAVRGMFEAYKMGDSGSTWLISGNKPAKDITANVKKGYDIMSQGVFEF